MWYDLSYWMYCSKTKLTEKLNHIWQKTGRLWGIFVGPNYLSDESTKCHSSVIFHYNEVCWFKKKKLFFLKDTCARDWGEGSKGSDRNCGVPLLCQCVFVYQTAFLVALSLPPNSPDLSIPNMPLKEHYKTRSSQVLMPPFPNPGRWDREDRLPLLCNCDIPHLV